MHLEGAGAFLSYDLTVAHERITVCHKCNFSGDGWQDGMCPFLADGTALALVGTAEKARAVPKCSAPLLQDVLGAWTRSGSRVTLCTVYYAQ